LSDDVESFENLAYDFAQPLSYTVQVLLTHCTTVVLNTKAQGTGGLNVYRLFEASTGTFLADRLFDHSTVGFLRELTSTYEGSGVYLQHLRVWRSVLIPVLHDLVKTRGDENVGDWARTVLTLVAGTRRPIWYSLPYVGTVGPSTVTECPLARRTEQHESQGGLGLRGQVTNKVFRALVAAELQIFQGYFVQNVDNQPTRLQIQAYVVIDDDDLMNIVNMMYESSGMCPHPQAIRQFHSEGFVGGLFRGDQKYGGRGRTSPGLYLRSRSIRELIVTVVFRVSEHMGVSLEEAWGQGVQDKSPYLLSICVSFSTINLYELAMELFHRNKLCLADQMRAVPVTQETYTLRSFFLATCAEGGKCHL